MNIKQILLLLKLRWWLVLLIFALIVGASTAVSLVLPKQYTATTTIQLDTKVDPVFAALFPNIGNPTFVGDQANILASDRIAGRVVKLLGLADNPQAVSQWREETEGRGTLESYYGDLLLTNLRVNPAPQSSTLVVSFSGKDPKFAAAVANTFSKAYLDYLIEVARQPGIEALKVFDERLRALRTELQASQDRVAAFQQKSGVVISNDRLNLEQQSLASAEAALQAALTAEAEASVRRATSGTELSGDVQSSPVVQGLKAQLAAEETRLREISEIYGNRHPQWIQVDAKVKALRGQINSEMTRVTGAAESGVQTAKLRVGELRAQVEQRKRAVMSMLSQRDEASVLLRDLDTAQKAFDGVAQRRAQLQTEILANQAPARVLSPAVEPLTHSKPNIPKNIALGVVMGLLAGMVAAIAMEFLNRRVRSEDDLLAAEGVPVIGVMSSKPLDSRTRILPAPVRHRLGPMAPQLTLDGSAP